MKATLKIIEKSIQLKISFVCKYKEDLQDFGFVFKKEKREKTPKFRKGDTKNAIIERQLKDYSEAISQQIIQPKRNGYIC